MMRIAVFFIGLCCCSGFAVAQPLPVIEVAPGIYAHFGEHQLPDKHNHGAIANIGFIIGDACVAVIDTGGNPQQGYALRSAIRNVTSLPVCYIINTHVHPDHIYGNSAFRKSGGKFVGHRKLPRAMAMRGPYYIEKAVEQLDVKLTKKDIIAPDLLVEKELKLDLGGRVLVLTAYPAAHTDNDLTVYDQKTNTLWISDLLFMRHIPVIDGSLKGWLKVLQGLEKKSFNKVIPGHGPLVTDWPQAMQPQKRYLQMLLNEIRMAIKQGVYMEAAMKTVGLSARDQWLLFEQFHRKNIATAFAELEWED